jgi:glycosyltransferase involved in cell wall biosynthesis
LLRRRPQFENHLISILLPNLNNRPFLEERIESIYRQTISDWELIIVDSYSEDGAWEFFKALASRDDHVKISQAPRQGIYAGWNECIRRASGRYVYFATSDDTMATDCLEKLSAALDKHPECGLAHCNLKLFDDRSKEIPKDWWWNGLFAQSSKNYVHRRHIRKAPFDGLLHLFGQTVYTSITQLMIRRSLFAETGLFPTNRGSIGDFQWVMKASLLNDTIHLPDTWGGWRQHRMQATAFSDKHSPEHWQALESMSRCALKEAEDFLVEPARSFIRSPAAMSNLRKNRIRAEFGSRTNLLDRLEYIVRETRKYPRTIAELMMGKIRAQIDLNRNSLPADWILFLKNHGLEPNLIPVNDGCS